MVTSARSPCTLAVVEEQTPAPPLRPQRVTDIVDQVFNLYARNFGLVVSVAALLVVPLELVGFLGRLAIPPEPHFLGHGAIRHLTRAQVHTLLHWLAPELVLVLLLIALQLMVVIPLTEGALTRLVGERYLGVRSALGHLYRFALGRLPALIGLGVVVALLYVAGLLVLFLVLAVVVAALHGVGVLLDVLLGLAALCAGVVVGVRLCVAVPAVVLEGRSPFEAIRRSWALTEGQAGRSFGLVLVMVIIEGLASVLVGLLVTAAARGLGGTGQPAGAALSDIGSLVIAVLVEPLLVMALALLYFDLRVRKEQFGTEELSARLSG